MRNGSGFNESRVALINVGFIDCLETIFLSEGRIGCLVKMKDGGWVFFRR